MHTFDYKALLPLWISKFKPIQGEQNVLQSCREHRLLNSSSYKLSLTPLLSVIVPASFRRFSLLDLEPTQAHVTAVDGTDTGPALKTRLNCIKPATLPWTGLGARVSVRRS